MSDELRDLFYEYGYTYYLFRKTYDDDSSYNLGIRLDKIAEKIIELAKKTDG